MFKFFKNSSSGITIIEIVIVCFFIALFSAILLADFPKIQRQFALSRATYKLAQDFRRVEDLGLSGVKISDINGNNILVKGFGIFINSNVPDQTKYIMYADVNGDKQYNDDGIYARCDRSLDSGDSITSDCVMETIDISKENPSLYIKGITTGSSEIYITGAFSINFKPPNPTINIVDDSDITYSGVRIVLALNTDDSQRVIWVNNAGLIRVQ